MKFDSPMIVVTNMEKSKEFYQTILKQTISLDLGNYLIWNDGFSMMSLEQWCKTNPHTNTQFGSDNFELYFEEDVYDNFVTFIQSHQITYLHETEEAPWGQRGMRFYDPDKHVIEVSESMNAVAKRYLGQGMSISEVSEKIMFPIDFVTQCAEELKENK